MIENLATAKQKLIKTEVDSVKMIKHGLNTGPRPLFPSIIRTVVSEVEPTSDKEEPKERGSVRSRANF